MDDNDTPNALPAEQQPEVPAPGTDQSYPEMAPAPEGTTAPIGETMEPGAVVESEEPPEIQESAAVVEPPTETAAAAAVEEAKPEGFPVDHPFWQSPEVVAFKKWMRDELELMQLGKSREQRETVLNP